MQSKENIDLDIEENDDAETSLDDLSIEQIQDMLPGFMRGVPKPGKYAGNRYYRGETKKLRYRTKVKADRKAQREARKANRGSVRGQKQVKGRQFNMQ